MISFRVGESSLNNAATKITNSTTFEEFNLVKGYVDARFLYERHTDS